MRFFTKIRIVFPLVIVCSLNSERVQAGIISFEDGFSEGDVVTDVLTSDNVVSFGVTGSNNAWVHKVGGNRTAFAPVDTPNGGNPGMFFLSDEAAVGSGLSNVGNYFLSFDRAITGLAIDTYDFRADGGASAGDVVTLELASDALFTSIVGSDSFTIAAGDIDGITRTLMVDLQPNQQALFARLVHSGSDIGTGIDNIRFSTIPEPTSALAWTLLLGTAIWSRRYRRAR